MYSVTKIAYTSFLILCAFIYLPSINMPFVFIMILISYFCWIKYISKFLFSYEKPPTAPLFMFLFVLNFSFNTPICSQWYPQWNFHPHSCLLLSGMWASKAKSWLRFPSHNIYSTHVLNFFQEENVSYQTCLFPLTDRRVENKQVQRRKRVNYCSKHQMF